MHIQWSHLSARNMPPRPHTRSVLITSYISQQNSTRSVSARSLGQRTQAGHTNRWQLPGALGSDLLGQAQVQKAEEFCSKSSDRKNNSADPMALHWHETAASGPHSPLPCLVHPHSACRRARLCKDVTWSSNTPEERFDVLSHRVTHNAKPDAVLECLGVRWKLHSSFLCSSDMLFELYTNSKRQQDAERAVIGKDSRVSSSASERGLVYRKWLLRGPLTLRLPVKDDSINKEALSFALRTLYDPEERPDEWGEAVLSTASLLGMSNLYQKCLIEMMAHISSSTVCSFHQVSCKFKETFLQRACERWLELFLVTELSFHIKLKDLPFDLMLKTLRCPRLFTSNEYEVLRAVLYWLYLKLNPLRETLPAHSTIIHFFSRETAVFLEQPQGQKYITIFQALRMHGITEWQHLQELQNIRVLPESWLLSILSNHYHTVSMCRDLKHNTIFNPPITPDVVPYLIHDLLVSKQLHSGGDMAVTDFSKQAIRFGMIFDGEQECCTQTISLCGFYFLLKAAKLGESDTYTFSFEGDLIPYNVSIHQMALSDGAINRLRHWDPAVSQSSIVSRPYCMRPDRLVSYHITVQSFANGSWQEHSSGPVSQEFGLCRRLSRSKPFQIEGLFQPILVTFALAFPF